MGLTVDTKCLILSKFTVIPMALFVSCSSGSGIIIPVSWERCAAQRFLGSVPKPALHCDFSLQCQFGEECVFPHGFMC